jgi:hypothetical protein
MPTREDYLAMPPAARLARLAETPDDVAAAIDGANDHALSPRADGWSAKEIVCHLRDIEELCILRYHLMLVDDDPHVFVAGAPPPNPGAWGIGGEVPFPMSPERWSEERQYLRNDTGQALAAFRRRRREVLAFLHALTPDQWRRGAIHPEHGRVTFEAWLAGVAAHDDNHLAQIATALRRD